MFFINRTQDWFYKHKEAFLDAHLQLSQGKQKISLHLSNSLDLPV